MKPRAPEAADTRQELALLLVLFVSLRLFLQFVSRPQGFVLDASDYNFYLDIAQLSDRGLYPTVDFWLEYPPVFPWLAVAVYKIIEVIPLLNGSGILWFRLTLGSVLLLFDVANLLLIYGLASTFQPPARAMRIAWTYALLFTPLHVWLGWFDTMPLFFLLLSLYLWANGRSGWAAMAAGFGLMVKVTPILAMPLLLKGAKSHGERARLVLIAAASALAVAVPFLVTGPQYLIASFQSMFARSPWGTPWAVMEGYFSYGKVAPLPERVDPATATNWHAYVSHWPWLAITAVFAAIFVLLWTRRFDVGKPFVALAFAGLTVNLFLLYSKGFSPQFLLYVVPFALLLLPPLRGVAYITALALLGLVEYPLYHTILQDDHWISWEVVWLRTGLLLLLSWEFFLGLGLAPSWERIRRPITAVAMLAFVVWSAFMVPRLGQSWFDESLAHHPSAALVEYIARNAGYTGIAVFTEPGLYRELYPFLNGRTNMVLIDPQPPGSRIASAAGVSAADSTSMDELDQLLVIRKQYSEIYNIYRIGEPNGERLERYLTHEPGFMATQRLNGISVTYWAKP